MDNNLVDFAHFEQIQIHVGEILTVSLNPKAKIKAYVLTIDFGHLGIKTSSAQLTDNYNQIDLIGKKICAVTNFPAKRVAGIKSEVLVLASICATRGTLLISPSQDALNGSRIG